jgi:hypothetical protein
VATGANLLEQEGHSRAVYSIAFHPDGSLCGSGGFDAAARVWDCRTGRSVLTFQGHTYGVLTMAFSPNGHHVATGAPLWIVRGVPNALLPQSLPAAPPWPPVALAGGGGWRSEYLRVSVSSRQWWRAVWLLCTAGGTCVRSCEWLLAVLSCSTSCTIAGERLALSLPVLPCHLRGLCIAHLHVWLHRAPVAGGGLE